MPTWQLHASHSHLYPGARLRVQERPAAPVRPHWQAGDRVLVEFADQAVSAGAVRAVQDDAVELSLRAYRTAKGTAIADKAWRLQWVPGEPGLRVTARLR
jgi:hypothetical protein